MKQFIVITFVVGCLGFSLFLISCQSAQQKKEIALAEQELKDFITQFEAKVYPLVKDMNLSGYQAAISGKDADFKKAAAAEFKFTQVFSNKEDFAILKKLKEAQKIKDPMLKRQLDVLYDAYVVKQVDDALNKKIVDLQNEIVQKFNTYKFVVKGQEVNSNKIDDILRNSTDSPELQAAWEASKEVGRAVAPDLITLVKLRNTVAQQLGFKNFHAMNLETKEQDPEQIEKLFDELDALTRDAFIAVKDDMDNVLSKKLGITKEELMPWHYQNKYFQEAPRIYEVNLDDYYKNQDVVKLTLDYYKSIGFEIQDILDRSDLYEKPGKDPAAFSTHIDYKGDVRILCNVKPDYYWMSTMLHEIGHAVYDKHTDMNLPLSIKDPAHPLTTEGIALMFGRLATNGQWLQDMLKISDAEKNKIAEESFKSLRLEMLVFSRWSQVMYRFEKALYENPDQDLNALWWSLVEKYQMIKKPEGRNVADWASKTHFSTAPCYYHNYLLGDLFASQLVHAVEKKVLKVKRGNTASSFYGHPEVGQFLIKEVFEVGKRYPWNDMIKKATGEKLTAKYYAEDFVK